MRQITTNEEKVAKVILYSVNDVTLDLDLVGEYLAEFSPALLYNRLDIVFDSAQYHKLNRYGYEEHEIARMRLSE